PLAKRGEAVEEVSHFFSHCSESEPDESKVKDEIRSQLDHLHVDQKSKEKHDKPEARSESTGICLLDAGTFLSLLYSKLGEATHDSNNGLAR
ncbi:9470_t:CDS:2, partial [Funneliformis geosporum]